MTDVRVHSRRSRQTSCLGHRPGSHLVTVTAASRIPAHVSRKIMAESKRLLRIVVAFGRLLDGPLHVLFVQGCDDRSVATA